MYESFYGLAEKPFSLSPDPKYLYRSRSHASAFERLQDALDRREGFVVISGDSGTGKTTLCRALLESTDPRTFTVLVLQPFASEEALLRAILEDLGVVSRGGTGRRSRRPGRQDLLSALHDFLLSLVPLGARLVLVIDEAQNVAPLLLEQVRILSNFETATEKLLQIVLVGQPGLLALLQSPDLRQLDQRVSVRYQLEPLAETEVAAYVEHRLAVAGATASPLFTPTALRVVHDYSGGIPRVINMLCDRALLGGYAAQTSVIDETLVTAAVEALELAPATRPPRSLLDRLLRRRRP